MNIIETERLWLRAWEDKDVAVFADINQDPKVCEFLPGPVSLNETVEWIGRINRHIRKHGYGLWAATLKDTGDVIGYVGLNVPSLKAHFTPCVEIGWRLSSEQWGKGYATEAAREVLRQGFERLGLKEIVSFTVPANLRSIRVMEKIGMTRDPQEDFLHPNLPANHPLAKHVLYRTKGNKFKS